MKICIVGAGAIGGFLGTRLACAGGSAISALARGDTLLALRRHGWRLRQGNDVFQAPAVVASDPHALGRQDLVIITVKGQSLPGLAPALAPLLGPDTIVLPAMNGVPWWFPEVVPAIGRTPLDTVDPGGVTTRAVPLPHVVGCAVYANTALLEPGFVVHQMGRRLVIGEPAGGSSNRVRALAQLLTSAGFDVATSQHICRDVWFKLWGNLTANPVSAITGATMDRLLDDELVRAFCTNAMHEAAAIGERIGCSVEQAPADRHALTRRLGAFKTSMLQDAEAGRSIELDSIVGAVREIGQRVGVPTPTIDALYGLARLHGRAHGLYGAS